MMLLSCPLTQRGVLCVRGDDRHVFLQGLISNDINLCVNGKMIYAALLTPQGKFLHDMFIVDSGESFLIDCEGGNHAEDLLRRLRVHKLRAKVTFENASDQFDVWAMWGEDRLHMSEVVWRKPEARQSTSQNLSSGPLDPGFCRHETNSYVDPRLESLGSRMIVPRGHMPICDIVDFIAYDKHRLMHGVPNGSRDMVIEKSTLLEGNFDLLNGISWTKGCYMGQELTARMHYRALVKKRLYPVNIVGPAPEFDTPITLDGQKVGEMRSSCGDVGLALLELEKTNGPLECSQARLIQCRPDWLQK